MKRRKAFEIRKEKLEHVRYLNEVEKVRLEEKKKMKLEVVRVFASTSNFLLFLPLFNGFFVFLRKGLRRYKGIF